MFQLDWHPIYLSLWIATQALCLVVFLGIPLSLYMARYSFYGKELVETLITLPLVLPPVVTGFALLVLLGKNGPMGGFLYKHFNIELIFTPQAATIAATFIAFPLMYQSAKTAFQNIDTTFEDVARTLGASELRIFYSITLPLAWPGLLSGMVLAYARALGEFGATIMIAGNIPGKTQTIPTAIYFAADANNLEIAGLYVVMISLITFSMIYGINLWSKKHNKLLANKEKY